MSDVSTTTSTYATQDTTLESCEEYLGVEVDLADLIEMSSDQLAAYFEKLYNESEISEDDIEAFEAALQAELDEFYADAEERKNQLQAMYESGNLSTGELANVEDLISELDTWLTYCDETILEAWGEGVAEGDEKHIEVEDGETHTFDAESPQDGDVYYVDMTSTSGTEDGSESAYNTDANADWIDVDGDGYKETNPDANNDGIADEDFDGDYDIDEDDLTAGATDSFTTFELNGDECDPKIEETYFSDYDEETNELTLKVTYEDGTINYIKITLPEGLDGVKLAISPIPENYESIPDDISAILYEKTSSEYSNYYFVHGTEPNVTGNYATIYDMTDHTAGLSIEPASTDFSESRDYTVNCSAAADTINLEFAAGVTLEFAYSDLDLSTNTCTMVITATDANGNKITITLNDFNVTDRINITGGTIASSSSDILDDQLSYDLLTADSDGDGVNETTGPYIGLDDIIYHDGAAISGRSDDEITSDKNELAASDYPITKTFTLPS